MALCRVKEPIATSGGACSPKLSGNQLSNEDPWAVEISACKVHMDAVSASGAMGICTRQDIGQSCKTGWNETVVYTTQNDTRQCTPCGCDFQECTSEFIIYDANNCAGDLGTRPVVVSTIATDVSALTKGNQYSVMRLKPVPPTDCIAEGGTPTGKVEVDGPNGPPDNAVTFCCK